MPSLLLQPEILAPVATVGGYLLRLLHTREQNSQRRWQEMWDKLQEQEDQIVRLSATVARLEKELEDCRGKV